MKLKRVLAAAMGITLIAMHPLQVVQAEEEVSDQLAAEVQEIDEAQAKLEAEKKEALETPIDTNSLENWPQGPEVYAHSAVVMDMDSGAVLYAKKADERHFPASITKLLTTLVALENAKLTDTVTFSQDSVDILNWDDAHIGMRPGEQITMEDALYAVLLASANEVSYAVAESTGINHLQGGYDTFIQLMNERAKELGCTGSNWVNPNGLHDENHYTTAHDMALIASAVYQQEEFRNIMKTLEYRIPATNLVDEERVFQQNHKMLWPENYYYYEYCTGGKTGYTDQSGTTLVTMADNGKMRLAAVVLYDYGVDAYTDTMAMMDYVFQNFSKVPVADMVKEGEVKGTVEQDAYVVLPSGVEISQLEQKIVSSENNEKRIVYTYQGQNVGSAEITMEKQVSEKNAVKEADKKKNEENPKTEKNWIPVVVIAAGVILVLGMVFFSVYVRYKKRQQRRRRIQKRRRAVRQNRSRQGNGNERRRRTEFDKRLKR